VTIADVDCTVHASLCERFGVRGYPSVKVFKRTGDSNGEEYNGGRDFEQLKAFVEKELDEGPACSLSAKDECDKDALKILEESEKMTKAKRTARLEELDAEIAAKKENEDDDIDFDEDQMKESKQQVKKLEETRRLIRLGGDKLEQLLSDKDFRAECESRVCVLAFLPHILDSSAAQRNTMLSTLSKVRARAARERVPVGFMWLQGGDQFEIEEKLSLQFGWPAVLAIHLKKERYGVHRGTFEEESVQGFIRSLMLGKVPLHPLPKEMGKFPKNDPWDGKDGELPHEEEL
jgi:hypothetical protein